MSVIHLLPDSVANQIAAGEVIQRPASVVKELVENSIDAGATLVQVLVVDAGKTSIQVIDNGCGMTEDDAQLSFERHATSKISKSADLFGLRTMGFRGEALASIAAVAQVELRTRTKEQELGLCLRVEGSRISGQEPVNCPVGANFVIRNLFYNVPARRRFLKSEHTELTNVVNEFERIALAHPALAFKLYSNETLLLDLPEGSFRQRITQIFGKKMDKQLMQVRVDTPLANIYGFVGTPKTSRKKSVHQYFFANDRFMRHPYFAKAVQSPFERLVPQGEQVPFFIRFEVDPAAIDVNIHPTKTEIKFADEQPLWQILSAAVREALGNYSELPTIEFDTVNKPEIPVYTGDRSAQFALPPEVRIDKQYNPFKSISMPARPTAATLHRVGELYQEASSMLPPEKDSVQTPMDASFQPPSELLHGSVESEDEVFLQYQGRYIVTSVKSGLLLVDQHRAHIRILYEQYMSQLSNNTGLSNGLLFSHTFSLSASKALVLDHIMSAIKAVGFNIEKKEDHSYEMKGVPAGTEGLNPQDLLETLLNEVEQENPVNAEEAVSEAIHQKIAIALARKSATPVGVVLSQREMAHLLGKLFSSAVPQYTPDGQNVLAIIPNGAIEACF